MGGTRRALVAVAAGLALADASIVALALPPILAEMHTTITGVAAVIGVYALVLAAAIWPASRVRVGPVGLRALRGGVAGLRRRRLARCAARLPRRAGGGRRGGADRGVRAAGRGRVPIGRRLWLGAALIGTAAGPAIGGALTEAFDWRAIFIVQAPIALAAAAASVRRQAAPAEPAVTVRGAPRRAAPGDGLWSRGDDAPARTSLWGAAEPQPAPGRRTRPCVEPADPAGTEPRRAGMLRRSAPATCRGGRARRRRAGRARRCHAGRRPMPRRPPGHAPRPPRPRRRRSPGHAGPRHAAPAPPGHTASRRRRRPGPPTPASPPTPHPPGSPRSPSPPRPSRRSCSCS